MWRSSLSSHEERCRPSYASNNAQTLQDVASDNFVNIDHDTQANNNIDFVVENDIGNQSNHHILDSNAFTCKFCGKSFASDDNLKVSL